VRRANDCAMLDTGLRSRNAGARHFAWSWSGNQIKNRKPKPELRFVQIKHPQPS